MWSESNPRDLNQRLAPGNYDGFGIIQMPSEISRAVTKLAYGVTQLPRVAWYIGHSLVLRELADTLRQSEKSKARRRVHTDAPVPDRKRIYADMAKLFLRDLANVGRAFIPFPRTTTVRSLP
jgi:hypothetical protein